jgi:SAM-dependent methyltransferase
MDSITNSVKSLYEKYPYPYTGVKDELLIDLSTLVYYIFYESETDSGEDCRLSFFDAGCGAGQRVLGLASEFPNSKFRCVDLCEHSLKIAGEQAKKHGIANITFQQDNLMELKEKGQYDVVTSVGVLHHTSDPARALSNISKLLKEDGIIIIHVYHEIGEYDRMLKREVARTLMGEGSIDEGIRVMKDLGYTLPSEQYGHYGYNPNLTDNDNTSKDADVFIHPRVFTYRFEEAIDLFRSTEMEWAAINSINTLQGSHFISSTVPVEPYSLDPATLLKTDHLIDLYKKLPLMDKLKILECITKPTSVSVVAGKRPGLSKVGKRLENNLIWLKSS